VIEILLRDGRTFEFPLATDFSAGEHWTTLYAPGPEGEPPRMIAAVPTEIVERVQRPNACEERPKDERLGYLQPPSEEPPA
jgi:hypothetical protein